MIQQPFTLSGDKHRWWDICDATGMRVADIPAILIDGSGRKDKYPTGVIRTREQQQELAEFMVKALNSTSTSP